MFTGLIADVGRIAVRDDDGEGARFLIETGFDLAELELGESIAVDGACLTVAGFEENCFGVEASPETLGCTTLGDRRVGDAVHLERALRADDRIGGHFVTGHVDGVGELAKKNRDENAWILEYRAPSSVANYLIEKGSIAVDGVSLTINGVDGDRFEVAIIPHTAESTHLVDHSVGRRVNLEADLLGKYVEKFVGER